MILLLVAMGCVEPVVEDSPEPVDPISYQNLLISGQQYRPRGRTPGCDIDAIFLQKANGDGYWAKEALAQELLGSQNEHTDVQDILGEGDIDCEDLEFVSLGGRGSFVVVNFGVQIDEGDVVTVYEIGSEMCPLTNGANEYWELTGLDSTDARDGVYIGSGRGLGEIEVLGG